MSMEVEKGLLLINGRDMAELGVFLAETTKDGHKNYDELLKGGETKEVTAVDFRERVGEELPEVLDIQLKARDVTLLFGIVADNTSEWLQRYKEFRGVLQSGWLNISLPELGSVFRFYLKAMPAHSQLSRLKGEGKQVAVMTVTLREPKPVF